MKYLKNSVPKPKRRLGIFSPSISIGLTPLIHIGQPLTVSPSPPTGCAG